MCRRTFLQLLIAAVVLVGVVSILVAHVSSSILGPVMGLPVVRVVLSWLLGRP